jgi:hypothetical protein
MWEIDLSWYFAESSGSLVATYWDSNAVPKDGWQISQWLWNTPEVSKLQLHSCESTNALCEWIQQFSVMLNLVVRKVITGSSHFVNRNLPQRDNPPWNVRKPAEIPPQNQTLYTIFSRDFQNISGKFTARRKTSRNAFRNVAQIQTAITLNTRHTSRHFTA